MELIKFCCQARFDGFFRQKKLQKVLLLSLSLFMALFYSWLFSFLLQRAQEDTFTPGVEQMLQYTNLLLLVLIILKGFFPAYVPRATIIQAIYPVGPLQKFRTELVVELVSPFYFVLLNFLLYLFLMSPMYTWLHFLQSLLVLLTAHVTLRSLQVIVERKLNWHHSHFITAAVMASAFVALQVQAPMFRPSQNGFLLVVHIAALGFFVCANFFLEKAATEPRRKVVHASDRRRSLAWRLFNNHKLARQMLLFGLAFKVIILAIDALSLAKTGEHIFERSFALWLFVGPLAIYSYVFNNIWGFYRHLWLTVERANGKVLDFVKASLIPLRVPLLLDAVLTAAYVTLFNQPQASFVVSMYLAAVLVLTPLGLISSIVSPKAVKGGLFSFGAKASYLFNFLAIGLFSMLFLPLLHPLLYLVYPVLIGGMLFSLVAVLREYGTYKYKLFETLFKTES